MAGKAVQTGRASQRQLPHMAPFELLDGVLQVLAAILLRERRVVGVGRAQRLLLGLWDLRGWREWAKWGWQVFV